MSKDNQIRLSWYAILVTGVLLSVFGYGKLFEPGPPYDDPLGGTDAVFEYSQIAVVPLGFFLFFGSLGFYRFYRKRLTNTGRLGWILIWIGSLAMMVGGMVYIPSRNSAFWQILVMGNFIASFGTLCIGIAGYRNKLFPKWKGAPFIIGISYTIIFVFGSLNPTYQADLLLGIVIFIVTSIGWILFGIALREGAQ